MKTPQAHVVELLMRWLSGLRFPTLFVIAAALFFADLVVPDMVPFVDEILLGLTTILLGRLKLRKSQEVRDRSRPTRRAPEVEVIVEPPSKTWRRA